MASTRALPALPASPSSKYNFPTPTKADPVLKPNPHPYSIKTSSSALLSRSGSSANNISLTKNVYVPPSPNASRSPENGKGHRASKSLNSESPVRSSPRPLPTTPSFGSPNRSTGGVSDGYMSPDDSDVAVHRTRRADTLPSAFDSVPRNAPLYGSDLPSNPKMWTPLQLSSYLLKSLRDDLQTSQKDRPARPSETSTNEVCAFVKNFKISGRTFLRLNDADLESMSANKEIRDTLLIASRDLRHSILRGRIWGAEQFLQSSPVSPSRPLPTPPWTNPSYASSSGSLDLDATSQSSADAPRHDQKYRNGRVKGMVQSLERSGSFSSSSDCGPENDTAGQRTKIAHWLRGEGAVEEQALRSPSPRERAPLRPDVAEKAEIQQEELSMDALLAAEESVDAHTAGSWGARAWEDILPGETAKRIVDPYTTSARTVETESQELPTITDADLSRGTGFRRGRTREERRIVTAIFSPTKAEEPQPDDAEPDERRQFDSRGVTTDLVDQGLLPVPDDSSTEALKAIENRELKLEAELAETRSLLEAFRERLEIVEQKISDLEETDAERTREQKLLIDSSTKSRAASVNGTSSNAVTVHRDGSPLLPAILRHLKALRGVTSALGRPATHRSDKEERDGPSSVSELPSYVLLVGVGVCAVVLQVVLKRLVGKAGWKP